jgi:hypothetical protein
MAVFTAYVRRAKKQHCDRCDGLEFADMNRYDCGCMWDAPIGDYDRKGVACMVAARQSMQPGTRNGGINTGGWHVEDDAEGIIEAGEQGRKK